MGKKDDTISVTIELPNGGSIKLEGSSKDVTESTVTIAQQLGVASATQGEVKDPVVRLEESPTISSQDDLKGDEILELDKVPKIDRLKYIIRAKLPHGWFNSKEVSELYRDIIEEIPFSTVSTYLKRLTEDAVLIRKGEKKNMEYRLNPEMREQIPFYTFKLETRKLVLESSSD